MHFIIIFGLQIYGLWLVGILLASSNAGGGRDVCMCGWTQAPEMWLNFSLIITKLIAHFRAVAQPRMLNVCGFICLFACANLPSELPKEFKSFDAGRTSEMNAYFTARQSRKTIFI